MSLRNFDSSTLTQRRRDKVEAGFASLATTLQNQARPIFLTPNPQTGNLSPDVLTEVYIGGSTQYAKGEGVFIRDVGCGCPAIAPPTNPPTVDDPAPEYSN